MPTVKKLRIGSKRTTIRNDSIGIQCNNIHTTEPLQRLKHSFFEKFDLLPTAARIAVRYIEERSSKPSSRRNEVPLKWGRRSPYPGYWFELPPISGDGRQSFSCGNNSEQSWKHKTLVNDKAWTLTAWDLRKILRWTRLLDWELHVGVSALHSWSNISGSSLIRCSDRPCSRYSIKQVFGAYWETWKVWIFNDSKLTSTDFWKSLSENSLSPFSIFRRRTIGQPDIFPVFLSRHFS